LEYCIKVIAVHEFGHALGFAHEQNRADAPKECQKERQGGDGDTYLTEYDLHSVMNYCNPKWSGDGKLSQKDIKGVQKFYGSRSRAIYYIGCFKDASNRDMGKEFIREGSMTVERCIAHCKGKGYSFAAPQAGDWCNCGNSYGKYGPATNCDSPCFGNRSQNCGGGWANSVYILDAIYIGCFKDASNRDMGKEFIREGSMTVERCIAHCKGKGYSFAAPQAGDWCNCGNSHGKYGPATNCDSPCFGNRSQKCGGAGQTAFIKSDKFVLI